MKSRQKRGRMLRIIAATLFATSILPFIGCSTMKSSKDKLGYEPEERETAESTAAAQEISSKLLDMTGMKGKGRITEPGPSTSVCERIDPDFVGHYFVYHPWSIYQTSNENLEKAMANLRRELPRHGWKITQDGPARSQAKDPVITAQNPESMHSVHITWRQKRASGKPLLHFSVSSRCFKVPEGSELR